MTILPKSVSVWNEIKKIKSPCQHKYPYSAIRVIVFLKSACYYPSYSLSILSLKTELNKYNNIVYIVKW